MTTPHAVSAPASNPTASRPRKSVIIEIERIKAQLRQRRGRRKPALRVAALNITSFLDMSFCLLMFLILSVGNGSAEGVFTAQPIKDTEETKDKAKDNDIQSVLIKRPIYLTVSARGEDRYIIEIDALQENVDSFDVLARKLTALRHDPRTNPTGVYEEDNPVIIRPRGDVPWHGVVSAFNAAVRARFKHVDFAPAP